VFEEQIFHPLVRIGPGLGVIGWVEVKERELAALCAGLKGVALKNPDSGGVGFAGAIGVKLNTIAGYVGARSELQ
jgi:hypothetical protein